MQQLPKNPSLTYAEAGVDINHTDAVKAEMAPLIGAGDPRVLNGLGPFASLYDINFPKIKEPVLVLKAEEPGSKQKLAAQYGYMESICHDMVNHLVNDIIVMGARPLAVLDTIVCGYAEPETVRTIIRGLSNACRENECSLVGGETSVQPGVVEKGIYILTSSIAGIADKKNILDGSTVAEGDAVLAVASNGLHTNGYSLVRRLMENDQELINESVENYTFLEAIMKPHTPYYRAVKDLFGDEALTGMAHITGGGIEGNLSRIMLEGLCASIDLSKIHIPAIFKRIKALTKATEEEMLRTFNCGVGLVVVARGGEAGANRIQRHIQQYYDCRVVGHVTQGSKKVRFINTLPW